jgi:hypothetical protein
MERIAQIVPRAAPRAVDNAAAHQLQQRIAALEGALAMHRSINAAWAAWIDSQPDKGQGQGLVSVRAALKNAVK